MIRLPIRLIFFGEQDLYYNILYHGIGNPLSIHISTFFHENGKGWRDLKASPLFIDKLKGGDLVLNLNYDTLFEISLDQQNRQWCYVPNTTPKENIDIKVAKPHGSLNMISNDKKCLFGQPTWLGQPGPNGDLHSYRGFVPPRFNKKYDQHPFAAATINKIQPIKPKFLTFWGIGLTDSDVDLVDLYKSWSNFAKKIELINPDISVKLKFEKALGKKIKIYKTIENWVAGKNEKNGF